MMPAVGSVWRKGDEWRRVIDLSGKTITFYRFGANIDFTEHETYWGRWAADAVQVPTETQQPVGLSDAEIDRIAERLHRKMRDMPVVKPLPVMRFEPPEEETPQ